MNNLKMYELEKYVNQSHVTFKVLANDLRLIFKLNLKKRK